MITKTHVRQKTRQGVFVDIRGHGCALVGCFPAAKIDTIALFMSGCIQDAAKHRALELEYDENHQCEE